MSRPIRCLAAIVAVGAGLGGEGAAWSAPRSYELPAETAAFADGPGQDVALENCTACRSGRLYRHAAARSAGCKGFLDG